VGDDWPGGGGPCEEQGVIRASRLLPVGLSSGHEIRHGPESTSAASDKSSKWITFRIAAYRDAMAKLGGEGAWDGQARSLFLVYFDSAS